MIAYSLVVFSLTLVPHFVQSYASILYLRIPHAFRITLRGKDVEHHDLVNDLMLKEKITYRPQTVDGVLKASNVL